MGKLFTTLGPRVFGGIASMAAGWIFVKTRGLVTIDANQVVEVGGAMIGSYAATHRVLSRFINPGDAAKSRLADAEKDAVNTGKVVQPYPPGSGE